MDSLKKDVVINNSNNIKNSNNSSTGIESSGVSSSSSSVGSTTTATTATSTAKVSTTNINNNNNNNTNGQWCKFHSTKRLKFLCLDCNVLLCSKGMSPDSNHKSHYIVNSDSLKNDILNNNLNSLNENTSAIASSGNSSIGNSNSTSNSNLGNGASSPTNNNMYTKRLDEIWKYMKQNNKSIETSKSTEEHIKQQFHLLREFLLSEERKLLTALFKEREKAEHNLQLLLNEAKVVQSILENLELNISSEIKQSKHFQQQQQQLQNSPQIINNSSNNNVNNCNNVNSNNIVVSNNTSYGSPFQQFLHLVKSSLLFRSNSNQKDQLVHLVQQHTSLANNKLTLKSDSTINRYKIDFDDLKLTEWKSAFQHTYQITDNRNRAMTCTTFLNQRYYILMTGRDSCNILDLGTLKLQNLKTDVNENEQRHHTFYVYSAVATNSHVFVFGGRPKSVSFSRFSNASLTWDHVGKITTDGGEGISTCFDGTRYIYLIGGRTNERDLRRIDRFDPETLQFEQICFFNRTLVNACSFHHRGNLYIIDRDFNEIASYNLETREIQTLTFDIGLNFIVSFCFDGNDLIYIVDEFGDFFALSLSKRTKQQISFPITAFYNNAKYPMLCINNLIYFLGGKKFGDYIYSIETNRWRKSRYFNFETDYNAAVYFYK